MNRIKKCKESHESLINPIDPARRGGSKKLKTVF